MISLLVGLTFVLALVGFITVVYFIMEWIEGIWEINSYGKQLAYQDYWVERYQKRYNSCKEDPTCPEPVLRDAELALARHIAERKKLLERRKTTLRL